MGGPWSIAVKSGFCKGALTLYLSALLSDNLPVRRRGGRSAVLAMDCDYVIYLVADR
jgi:hypothetical protein